MSLLVGFPYPASLDGHFVFVFGHHNAMQLNKAVEPAISLPNYKKPWARRHDSQRNALFRCLVVGGCRRAACLPGQMEPLQAPHDDIDSDTLDLTPVICPRLAVVMPGPDSYHGGGARIPSN